MVNKILRKWAIAIASIGAINVGSIALFKTNFVEMLLSTWPVAVTVAAVGVGVAGGITLWTEFEFGKKLKNTF